MNEPDGMRTLQLRNLEYLLAMGSKMPTLTLEHKNRVISNLSKFEPIGIDEKVRKDVALIILNRKETVG